MRWNDYPVIRLLLPFIAGIFFSYYTHIKASILFSGFIFLLISLFLFSYFRRLYPSYKYRAVSGITIYLLFFITGILISTFHYPYENPGYYGHFNNVNGITGAVIGEAPVETKKSIKIIADVKFKITDSVTIPLTGKIVLYIKKNTANRHLHYGDIIVWQKIPVKIKPPVNPESFDYSLFMERKGYRYHLFLNDGEWTKTGSIGDFSIKKTSLKIRELLMGYFRDNGITGDEYAVASSLILGYRKDISDDLLKAYRSAGVMHVLCVSGMHVGIIYLIINYLFGFLQKKPFGPQIRLFLILFSVWSFALITGMSPSVTRAAVMFSFVSIGQNIGRHINIYNTIAASAFIILIFSPFSLFDIGFILSYAAVISIAALYKPIYSLWIPRARIPDLIWKIASVSIAAQIGTFPFTLYYFHQFPNYFLLTNIIIIILITPVFYMTLLSLILSFYTPLAQIPAWIASKLIAFMNTFILKVSNLPHSTTSEVYLSYPFLLLLLFLIIATGIMVINNKPKMLFAVLSIIIIMLTHSIIRENKINKSGSMVAFNANGHTAVLFRNGHKSVMAVDSSAYNDISKIRYQTSGYILKYKLKPDLINLDSRTEYNGLVYKKNNVLVFNNQIFVFDYNKKLLPKYDCNYLIIRNKKDCSINEKTDCIPTGKILLSSQLSYRQAEILKEKLKNQNLPFYDLKNSFAFVKEWN